MNIKDVTGLGGARPVDPSRGNSDAPQKRSSPDASEPSHTSDRLSLTSVGQYLASEGSAESAPVDQQRVDAIRSALANGTYEVDAQRLAAKMLSLDRKLL